MEINVKKLVTNADVFELLKLGWALDKAAVKKEFEIHGVFVYSHKDLKTLATLHENGGDVAGVLKNKFGQAIYFDVEQILLNTKSEFTGKFQTKKLNLNWY